MANIFIVAPDSSMFADDRGWVWGGQSERLNARLFIHADGINRLGPPRTGMAPAE